MLITMDEKERQVIISDYQEAIQQCLEILSSIDRKYRTYGVIEVKDIDITPFGALYHRYVRSLEWREIRLQ